MWTAFYQQTKFYNEMISYFLSQRGHEKIKSCEEMGSGFLIIRQRMIKDPLLPDSGDILEFATSCNLIQETKRTRVGTFLEVYRAFENGNMSLFLALLLASLKAAETPCVFLYREVSQNLKNCKQCSKVIYRIIKKKSYINEVIY